jgi:hypothetical protein
MLVYLIPRLMTNDVSSPPPESAQPAAEQEPPMPTSGPSNASARFAEATHLFQRYLLPFLLPPLLLVMITAIVVVRGSGLLLLGTGDLQLGPVVVGKAVAAAGLGVLVIGSFALWLAMRA